MAQERELSQIEQDILNLNEIYKGQKFEAVIYSEVTEDNKIKTWAVSSKLRE